MGNDRKDSIIKKYKVISVSFSNVFIVRVELLQHWFWEIMKTHERFSFTKQTCPAHISSYTHTHAHTHTPRPRQCGIWLIINKKVQPLNNMFLSITLGIYSWKGTCNCFLLPLTNTHIHLHVHILTHTETHTIPSTRGRQLFQYRCHKLFSLHNRVSRDLQLIGSHYENVILHFEALRLFLAYRLLQCHGLQAEGSSQQPHPHPAGAQRWKDISFYNMVYLAFSSLKKHTSHHQ